VTVLKASRSPVALALGKPASTRVVSQWVRPSDWLTLTPPTSAEQKFVGLIAVLNQGSNYVSLIANVSAGTYTVDWGDGSSPVTAVSGVAAEYNYAYSSISASTDTSRGYRQAIVTVTPTTPGATFSLFSLASRHSARTSTQTVVTWLDIAISAPNATTVRLGYDAAGTAVVALKWLEQATIVAHNTTNMATMFRLCTELQSVPLFDTSSVTSMNSMFVNCTSLQTVPLFDTANVLDMATMFSSCVSLTTVPLFNTIRVTTMATMFNLCSALQSVPLFNTVAVISMNGMLNTCASLTTVPLFNTATVTDMGSMFQSCTSLTTVPLFNTVAVTSMSSMFQSCTSLQTVPLFNMAAAINIGSMFNACSSLQSVPLFVTTTVTNMANMFNTCTALQTVPLFNTAAVTTMSGMFSNCSSLQTLPLLVTTAMTNASSMLSSCTSLREIPELNLVKISSNNNNALGLSNLFTLGKAKLTSNRWTQTFSADNMAAAQLDEMYTALATLNPSVTNVTASGGVVTYTVDDIRAFVAARTVTITAVDPIAYNLTGVTVGTVTAGVGNAGTFTVTNAAVGTYVSGGVASLTDNRTITVTGNPGISGDDPTIATNKGWTVTGS
jgi:surface protein